MAVEAHQLLHIGGGGGGQKHLLPHAGPGWAACWPAADGATRYDDAPAHAQRPCYGAAREVAAPGRPMCQHQQQGLQFHQSSSSCVGMGPSALAAPSPVMAGQYGAAGNLCAADVASESGVTFGGGGGGGGGARQDAMATAPRKRRRAEQPWQQAAAPVLGAGATDVAAHFRNQLLDVDRLVLQHTAKMWAELTEQRRRHARQVVATVEAAVAKRLRAKDDEIERIGRLNWALEERVKSLYVEAQVWRDLAQSNEAAAAALRGELRQTLDAQAQQQARCGGGDYSGADDAESGCCGDNGVAAEEDREVATSSARRGCAVCGGGVADVLLLPCRHLCLCTPCAGETPACPACGCAKNGSISVNFS